MRVLGIETSSTQASVAILGGDGSFVRRQTDEPQQHAERLMPLIQSCLDEAGWRLGDVERVAVGVGPGSFTGLRVGIALGQGIALGLGISLVGVPSLLALAREAQAQHPAEVLVPIVDARRGEVFMAAFGPDSEVAAPWAVAYDHALESAEQLLGGRPFLGVGRMALQLFGPARTATLAQNPGADAAWVARVGAGLEPQSEVLPLYARAPDVVLPSLVKNPLAD